MKIIGNLTLDISMTGAWSGDNIKVTAKVWNGKITKTGTLSGSYQVDSIALDGSMYSDEYAVFAITTSQYIGSSRNQHKTTYSQVSVKGIAMKGWDKAYGKRENWANKALGFADSVVIQVPGSSYDTSNRFTVSSPGISSVTSSSDHGNFPNYMNVYINGSNGATAGPFGCDTRAVITAAYNRIYDIQSSTSNSNYPSYKTVYVYDTSMTAVAGPFDCYTGDVWRAAAGKEIGCNNKTLSPGTYTDITVPSTTPGGSFTFRVSASTSGGGGGGDCCFPAGTPVLLADGTTMPIEKLTVGTIVIGYDPDMQQFCETEIMRTIQKKHRNDIYELERADGITFLMTANHVVLTKNGWKAIDPERGKHGVPDEDITELIIGDELLGVNGNYIKIENIKYRDDLQDQNVYNIDVEEADTFIAYGIVAHNDVDCGNQ